MRATDPVRCRNTSKRFLQPFSGSRQHSLSPSISQEAHSLRFLEGQFVDNGVMLKNRFDHEKNGLTCTNNGARKKT